MAWSGTLAEIRYNQLKGRWMSRSGRRKNESVESVLQEAEKNLHAAFEKSKKTVHNGLKGDGRSKYVMDFLEERLPKAYGFTHKGEAVDYLDSRSGEIDIAIYDKIRNAPLSDDPIWLPSESLLAVIEVKTTLAEEDLKNAYLSSRKINSLRPFKRRFTLRVLITRKSQQRSRPAQQIHFDASERYLPTALI